MNFKRIILINFLIICFSIPLAKSYAELKKSISTGASVQIFPEQNPHPPLTEKDKAITQFAEKMIQKELMKKSENFAEFNNNYGLVVKYKHLHIIPSSMTKRLNEQRSLDQGKIEEPLKEDEFAVHAYVRFAKQPNEVYNLKIILAENKNGELNVRRFYASPLHDNDMKIKLC